MLGITKFGYWVFERAPRRKTQNRNNCLLLDVSLRTKEYSKTRGYEACDIMLRPNLSGFRAIDVSRSRRFPAQARVLGQELFCGQTDF